MKTLITGGAGFIGCNTARRLLGLGHEIVIVDTCVRGKVERNLEWLRTIGPIAHERLDIRDAAAMEDLFQRHRDTANVIHLAAQVAVTTSVQNPREDFEINAAGTFNLLEGIRRAGIAPTFLYSSTNKVYGGLEHVPTEERGGRREFVNLPGGVSEDMPLDFHSPYGCSKGCADQYVHDFSRIYGLPSVVFRQSCIYGPRQMGVEDQGWVAWFAICAVLGRPLTLYGDGKQVRDALYVYDLVDGYVAAIDHIATARGRAYNIGGGPENSVSLLELVAMLGELNGKPLDVSFAAPRPGDQPVFVCDVTKAKNDLGWKPKTPFRGGVEQLYRWIVDNRNLFE